MFAKVMTTTFRYKHLARKKTLSLCESSRLCPFNLNYVIVYPQTPAGAHSAKVDLGVTDDAFNLYQPLLVL